MERASLSFISNMKKGSSMPKHSSTPLTVFVGSARIPVLVNSITFRRTIREAAQICVAGHPEKRPVSRSGQKAKDLLQQVYQRVLVQLLTMPLKDECSTTSLLACLNKRKHGSENTIVPWDPLRLHQRVLAIGSKRDARLKRLTVCEEQCSGLQIEEGVQEFEDSVELQARLQQINRKDAVGSVSFLRSDAALPSMIRTPIPWAETDPPLIFGLDGAFFGRSTVHPKDLTHVLALGGTGVGKTESVTKPAVAAALAYQLRDGTKAAVLVIDPKAELIDKVKAVLTARGEMDRLFVVGQHPPVKLFPVDSPLSQSDRFQKLKAYVPRSERGGQNDYWKQLGEAMVVDLMQLEEQYAKQTGDQRLMSTLAKELRLSTNQTAGYWTVLRDVLAYSCTGPVKLKATSHLLRRYCRAAGIVSSSMQVMDTYTGANDLIEQWNYVVMSAQAIITALANPDLEEYVNLDILGESEQPYTDVAELVDGSKVILFCPQPKSAHDIATKALKEKFYEASLARKNLRTGVFIIIDEFHRFVTDDAKSQSSEASFIDVCRAFRVNMFLATQALGSIKRALGSDTAAQNAVDVLCQNTPTKVIFRCSDVDTVSWLKTQIPHPADGSPHVISVRPPSGLAPGEAYNLWADGTWGRQRARLNGLA